MADERPILETACQRAREDADRTDERTPNEDEENRDGDQRRVLCDGFVMRRHLVDGPLPVETSGTSITTTTMSYGPSTI